MNVPLSTIAAGRRSKDPNLVGHIGIPHPIAVTVLNYGRRINVIEQRFRRWFPLNAICATGFKKRVVPGTAREMRRAEPHSQFAILRDR